jgi:hypothetical protein
MEVTTHGTPVEVTKPLALGNETLWRPSNFRPNIETAPKTPGAVSVVSRLAVTGRL